MIILAFKLFFTPILIGLVTLVGRRWGPIVSGLMVGLPLTSGPISFFLAYQYGVGFAAKAATGNMVGLISVSMFCLVYSLAAFRSRWLASASLAIGAFLVTTFIVNIFSWSQIVAAIVLLAVIGLVTRLIPRYPLSQNVFKPPAWDLPARMVIATTFVLLLTTFANVLGPQLSGLLSPFPVFSVVLGAFTHHQQGPKAVTNLLRSIVAGTIAYGCFFLIVGLFLTHLGLAWTYLFATTAAVSVSGTLYFLHV
jgi:hypothetical protein